MKIRVSVLFTSVIFLLVLGGGMIVTAQQWTDGVFAAPYLYETVLYRPASNKIPPTAAIQSISSEERVLITDLGIDPNQVTIQAGRAVTWVNQTSTTQQLVSGQPYQVYLPMVLRNATGSASAADAMMIGQSTTSVSGWGSEIAPGGIYTRTFTEDGDHLYFIADHPDWTGRVVVQPPPAEATVEIENYAQCTIRFTLDGPVYKSSVIVPGGGATIQIAPGSYSRFVNFLAPCSGVRSGTMTLESGGIYTCLIQPNLDVNCFVQPSTVPPLSRSFTHPNCAAN